MRDPRQQRRRAGHGLDRTQVIQAVTFWLRPGFLLRVLNRFQRVAGFDRAVALASSALTAIIPLAIVGGTLLEHVGGKDFAQRIIDRYELTGRGAAAVEDIFQPAGATSTSAGIAGVLLLLVAVLSFTRAVQRLFEQAWELEPLSVRNTPNGLLWACGLAAYLAVGTLLQALVGHGRVDLVAIALTLPISFVFLVWTGRVLTARRLTRGELVPFGAVTAIGLAIWGVGATVWVPHLFNSYAGRYGVIGAVFAMISALFCIAFVLVAGAALGREIADELASIRRGEVPPEHEIRREWDNLVEEARTRWASLREHVHRGPSAPKA